MLVMGGCEVGGEWVVNYKWGREGKREGVVYWLVVERGGWKGCEKVLILHR